MTERVREIEHKKEGKIMGLLIGVLIVVVLVFAILHLSGGPRRF